MKKFLAKGILGCVLLAAGYLLPAITKAQPAPLPFTDLESTTPYLSDILTLYQKGIIVGYADGTFRPNQNITRAEFTKLTLAAGQCLDCQFPPVEVRNAYVEAPFPDVSTASWYYYCVSIAKKLGIVTGYLGGGESGSFKPEESISRAESIAVLLRASNIAPSNKSLFELDDVPATAWYEPYIQTALSIGLIPYENGIIKPEEKISRAEFAHLSNKVLVLQSCQNPVRAPSDEDHDGVLNELDKCPVTPGTVENQGCPEGVDPNIIDTTSDRDGDGTLDRNDKCITTPGPRENLGCPYDDRDGDGVVDKDDRCPDVPGPVENKGCPYGDRDGDGTLDRDDQCPDVPGPKDNKGCPYSDRDRDGTLDQDDDCPDVQGPLENRGCPWNTNQSNANQNSTTNTNQNSSNNQNTNNSSRNSNANNSTNQNTNTNSAPNDRDGDKVLDSVDKCPNLPGDLANATMKDGCPFVTEPKFNPPTNPLQVVECNICPCPTITPAADLQSHDIIFATITDEKTTRVYGKSQMWEIK